MNNLLIFAGRSNPDLAQKVANELDMPLGEVLIKNFSDKEIFAQYKDNVRGKQVAIIQTTNPPADNLLELLILIDAAKRASADKVIAVIPYFGYSRQERKDQPRVAITAKLVANLLTAAGADRIITIDLHSPAIQGFFDIPVDHVFGSYALLPYWEAKKIPNLVVAASDVGGIKMARKWSKLMKTELVVLDKRRPKQNESEVVNVIGSVDGFNVLVVDDLVDTGGTLIHGANALRAKGAKDIYACCVHGIFSGDAQINLQSSIIKSIITTNTIHTKIDALNKLEIISVAELLAKTIDNASRGKSITSLFREEENKT